MLTLYYHPLASFCWKVLIALHDNGTPFEPRLIDLGDPASRAELLALWPLGKFPVIVDDGRIIGESSIIIEYLDRQHPGRTRFVPAAIDLDVRAYDRFCDLHLHEPMQKVVGDRLRPADQRDPYGVAQARDQIATALDLLERRMATRRWVAGPAFTLADCAAAPALYYVDRIQPFTETHPATTAYLERLRERASFARVLEEAAPYFKHFPA